MIRPAEVVLEHIAGLAVRVARLKARQAAADAVDSVEVWLAHHEGVTAARRIEHAQAARLGE